MRKQNFRKLGSVEYKLYSKNVLLKKSDEFGYSETVQVMEKILARSSPSPTPY